MTKVLKAKEVIEKEGAEAVGEELAPLFQVKKPKKKILFVCTGNTCRSPMCAAAVNGLSPYREQWFAFSAGLCPEKDAPISEKALRALEAAGIAPVPENDYRAHRAREVCEADLAACDQAAALTAGHAFRLALLFPAYAAKICTFGKDIPDPFGGSDEEYQSCLAAILEALPALLSGAQRPQAEEEDGERDSPDGKDPGKDRQD